MLASVLDAGRLATELRRSENRHWRKEDGTPVSEADHAVDRLLMKRLREARPGYGWRSEESAGEDFPPDRSAWFVDPIDGTRAFLAGQPQWSICVALVERGRPIIGVVHAPALEQTFAAATGRGATLNGEPIAVTGRQQLAAAVVLANQNAFRPERWRVALPRVDGGSLASLALRLCSVAGGSADAALAFTHKHDWDLAAGDLIVCEAGGRVSDLAGDQLHYEANSCRRSGFLAATPAVHAAILAHGPRSEDEWRRQ